MKNKGFTLVELLAVIVILSLVITIGTFSVMKIRNNSLKKIVDTKVNDLEASAIVYGQEEPDILDSKCNIIYSDSNVNNKCKNYKYNYELIVNVYMNDINNYNKKLNSYNDNYDEKLEEYKTKYNYIDYNNDKKYEEVETNE